MRTQRTWLGVVVTALLALPMGSALRAQAGPADDSQVDPGSGATFGRVRYLEGGLSLQSSAEGQITDATINDPIGPGDRLTTQDGRSEIALSDGSTLWLDRGTQLDVRNLADLGSRYESTNLFALEAGAIRIEAPEPESKSKTWRVDTEAGSIYLLSGGSFRIETEEGITTLYSFRGVAELSGDDGSVLVRTGERGSVQSSLAPSEPRRFNTARLDDFDTFCDERLRAYVRSDQDAPVDQVVDAVPEEVHPYVNELSSYGSWRQVPDYGWVWRPVYSGAWGPYVNGYWTWCPTGWVWVSSDPWGWAPYHYGRWDFAVDIGWFWIPGRVWSGAWVSFAVGSGHIGWCPLNYYNRPVFQDVTVVNVNVVNVGVNRLQPRGWRFVPTDQFCNPRATRAGIRADRLPRGTDVVLTSRLPRFDPREVAARPDRGAHFVDTVRQSRAPLPTAVDRDNKPVPFRDTERVAPVPRGRRGASAAETRERARSTRSRPEGRPDASQVAPRPGSAPDGPARPYGRPAGGSREWSQPPQSHPRGAPGGTQPPGQREGSAPRERVAPPSRVPAQGPAAPARPQGQGQGPMRGDDRSRPRSTGPGRAPQAAPAPDAQRPQANRQTGRSDEAAERLFDGMRGRPRQDAQPQRVPPPPAARPEMKPPPRPEMKAPPRPAPSHAPHPKPHEGDDKDKGH